MQNSTRPKFPIAVMLIFLIIGMAIGVLVMRQRYKAKDVVVAVNGVTIDKQELFRRLEAMAGPRAVHDMVNELMQIQYAKSLNVAPSDAEVNAKYDEMAKQPGFERSLSQNDQTQDDIKTAIRASMSQTAILTRGQTASDSEIRAYYQQNIRPDNPRARFYTPDAIQISVIVTGSQADANKAVSAMNGGMSFLNAAKNFSIDVSSKMNGGILPAILRGRTKAASIPGFESALFGMKIGQMIGPRSFAGKWWIIRCIDRKEASSQPFDQVKDECRQAVLLGKLTKGDANKIQEGYKNYQKNCVIQAFWPEYKAAAGVQ
jgi:parvulin-like peptidyl-prolyl isomerase